MNYYHCIESCPLAANRINDRLAFVCNICGRDLYFSPVGNVIPNPEVIICGQTPDFKTMKKFWAMVDSGCSFKLSGLQSVFSNKTLRKNLFTELAEIDFFEFMKAINPYWLSDTETALWNGIFENEDKSLRTGIQLTQSCNCAIVDGKTSKQPPKTVFTEITHQAPKCLFNSFQITNNLKLIIFLDSPSKDGRYHQIDYFKKTDKYKWCLKNNIEIICIPHPSGANRIFNNTESLRNNKHIIMAKETMKNLIEK